LKSPNIQKSDGLRVPTLFDQPFDLGSLALQTEMVHPELNVDLDRKNHFLNFLSFCQEQLHPSHGKLENNLVKTLDSRKSMNSGPQVLRTFIG
jgi:hypothetical protein